MRKILLFLLSSVSLIHAQFDMFRQFPLQDTTAEIGKSKIITLSDNSYLFFWIEDRNICMAEGDGINWSNKKVLNSELHENSHYRDFAALMTYSNNLILTYVKKVDTLETIFLTNSTDNGNSWSTPKQVFSGTRSQKFIRDQNLVQSHDNSIWLIFDYNNSIKLTKSSDEGLNWSDQTFPYLKYTSGSLVSIDDTTLFVFHRYFEKSSQPSNLYYRKSEDNGITWSDTIRIFEDEYHDFKPMANIDESGRITLTFTRREGTFGEYFFNYITFGSHLNYEIFKIHSDNNALTWSNKKRITEFAGHDVLSSQEAYSNEPLITFLSTRYIKEFDIGSREQRIWYGILNVSEDILVHPIVRSPNVIPELPRIDTTTTFTVMVYDNQTVEEVKLNYSVNGVEQESVLMFDDGSNGDDTALDSMYSCTLDGFDIFDQIDYKFSATNISNNSYESRLYTIDYLYPYGQETFYFDINNLKLPIANNGNIADLSIADASGKEINNGRFEEGEILYASGFYLSGFVNGQLWGNGFIGSDRVEDYVPGKVGSGSTDPLNKLYIIRYTDPPFSNSWKAWKNAVALGARFYDGDGDGKYNPIDINENGLWDLNEDMPDLRGDLTTWCIFNDGSDVDSRRYSTPPLGIEIKQTMFAYSEDSYTQLANTVFINYEINNTGLVSNLLDSVLFSCATDPDIGDYQNDYVGSDTTIHSAYGYDFGKDSDYGNSPAFFINMLEGPNLYIPNETYYDNNENDEYDEGSDTPITTAYNMKGSKYGVKILPGAKNVKMISNHSNVRTDPTFGIPDDEQELRYYQIGGYLSNGTTINPCNFPTSKVLEEDCNAINNKFMYSGDPIRETGWLCNIGTDHRQYATTGPFDLEVGKPINILVAYTVGRGNTSLESVDVAKELSKKVIGFYNTNFNHIPVRVEESVNKHLPKNLYLSQNHPNPFNPSTKIKFGLPREGKVSLTIYNTLGQEVAQLVNQQLRAGFHEFEFDGNSLASGIYFYRLQAGSFIETKKMMLIK